MSFPQEHKMFKLQPNPTFKAPVLLSVPGEDKPKEIVVEFRHQTGKQLKAYFEHIKGKTDAEAVVDLIVGWGGVDKAYSAEALDELLDNYPVAAGEIFAAYRESALESRRKNS